MRWVSPRATGATACERRDVFAGARARKEAPVIRWMIVIFLALLLISWFTPLLNKLGFGKLPGDFRFRLFGREWFIPLTTTLLLSFVAGVIAKFI